MDSVIFCVAFSYQLLKPFASCAAESKKKKKRRCLAKTFNCNVSLAHVSQVSIFEKLLMVAVQSAQHFLLWNGIPDEFLHAAPRQEVRMYSVFLFISLVPVEPGDAGQKRTGITKRRALAEAETPSEPVESIMHSNGWMKGIVQGKCD